LLTNIAAQFYNHGEKVPYGLEPITLAVVLAEQHGRKSELRRALSIQGLILETMGNTRAAIQSLGRALSLAEELADPLGVVAAWVNMGVVLFDGTLYSDALPMYSKALAIAERAGQYPNEEIRSLLGIANCHLQLHSIEEGIAACERGLALSALVASTPESEQVASIFEAIYARLLLEANRPTDALAYAVRAVDLAERSGTHRAINYARMVRGLVDVYLGSPVEGLAQILPAKENVRKLPGSHFEAIRLSILAYERAGRPDAALASYRELMTQIAKSRADSSTWPISESGAVKHRAGQRSDADAYDSLASRVQLLLKLLPLPTRR
jgi:tetratricopeptide (TPR) repeat protein